MLTVRASQLRDDNLKSYATVILLKKFAQILKQPGN
jgi:hypothetical protein